MAKMNDSFQAPKRLSIGEVRQRHIETSLPLLKRLPRTLQSHDTPPVFGMEDMRLFNHFIQNAYPNHPHGNDSVWTHEIPSLASNVSLLLPTSLSW